MNNILSNPKAVITEVYRALQSGEVDAAVALLAPDIVLHVPGRHDTAGDYAGLTAVVGYLVNLSSRTDSGEYYELIDILEGDNHLAAYCRIRATREGRPPLDNYTVHLARITDGRITEIWFHNRDSAAVESFWT